MALLALGLILAAGGLGWLYLKAVSEHQVLDADLCPSSGPVAQSLVLVDTTDALSDVTQTEVLTMLNDLANAAPAGGLFEIRALTTDRDPAKVIFSLCNPGNGADLDRLTSNPELARKRWEQGFEGPLKAALTAAMTADQANSSPIMGGLQQLAVERLSSKQSRGIPTTVVVVSDMLENTGAFSVYQGGADYERFKTTPASARYATDFAGADIEIWMVRRANSKVPSLTLLDFWRQWIVAAHGTLSRAVNLQGMP